MSTKLLGPTLLFASLLAVAAGCEKGSSVTRPRERCPNPDARIPADVPSNNRCEWIDYSKPPAAFPDAIGWIAALSLDGSQSKVELDYIRLHACVAGRDSVIWASEFNVPDQQVCGDTWKRTPWFNDGGPGESDLPYTLDPAGYVVLAPSSRPNRVFHLWNCGWPRVAVPGTASAVWTEVSARITGAAALQVGYDFWKHPPETLNVQGGQSDWYFGSVQWQTIRVRGSCR